MISIQSQVVIIIIASVLLIAGSLVCFYHLDDIAIAVTTTSSSRRSSSSHHHDHEPITALSDPATHYPENSSLFMQSITEGGRGGGGAGDGCHSVYLDLGTNLGVQIRKLYEPNDYPNALIHPRFKKYFGSPSEYDRHRICSFGFEPNPHHTLNNTRMVKRLRQLGYRVHIFHETGVGDRDATLFFKFDRAYVGTEIAATFIGDAALGAVGVKDGWAQSVPVINFGEWMHKHIVKRRLPPPTPSPASHPPVVVMKVDIEGMDLSLVRSMVRSGTICTVNYAYTEHLSETHLLKIQELLDFAGCGDTTFEEMDDETYFDVDLDFNEPGNENVKQGVIPLQVS